MKTVIKMCSILAFSLCLFSCQSEEDKRKEWLEKNLTEYLDEQAESDYLNNNQKKIEEIEETIFTLEYLEYKYDAIGIHYDYGMLEEEFIKKWDGIFDTRYAGTYDGLIICGNGGIDYDFKLEISFKKKVDEIYYYDFKLNGCPPTVIKVSKIDGNYKIVDILEGILIRKQNF